MTFELSPPRGVQKHCRECGALCEGRVENRRQLCREHVDDVDARDLANGERQACALERIAATLERIEENGANLFALPEARAKSGAPAVRGH